MTTRTKRHALHISLFTISALSILPIALPANEIESIPNNSITSSNKRVASFFTDGATKSAITFTELLAELCKCHASFKKIYDEACAAQHEVQTVDLIAVIIENRERLPLDIQDALTAMQTAMQTRAGAVQLRDSLEILFNEAKALELLENQLSDDPHKRLPWRTLCERVALFLKNNRDYTDFAKALMAAKDSYCVLFAKIRLKEHLKRLPKRIADVAKKVEESHPGDVVPRIFWEG